MTTTSWTPDDERTLVELLERLPQPWPYSVFRAMVTKIPYASVEVILLKRVDGNILVHLIERDATDPDFRGQLHFTGSVVRETDSTFEDAIQRIFNNELNAKLVDAHYVGYGNEPPLLIDTPRGKTVEIIYLCTADREPTVGAFYDVDNLPPNLIPHQLPALRLAIDYFTAKWPR
ncbi:MAG: hypothetical protein WC505_00635 [Patescibacteria group bacterium]